MKVIDHKKIEELRKLAFELNAAEQYRLAFLIAENIGCGFKSLDPLSELSKEDNTAYRKVKQPPGFKF